MKLQFIKSATTLVEANGVRILTDPWLVDGEYYGSWHHYPAYATSADEFDASQFRDVNYIYISHIHPDHFSRPTMAALTPDRLGRSIPVLIHRYEAKFLQRNLQSMGFEVRELPHNQRTDLGDGVSINILAADNCNPELCGKFLGCGKVETRFGSTQIDSLAVFDDGQHTLLNINDCPFGLAQATAQSIREIYQQIDLLLVGYAGAGPYPQCFENLSREQKVNAATNKKLQFLNQGLQFLKLFQPAYYMPFAGTYVLGGELGELNELRGVPEIEEALEFFERELVGSSPSYGFLLNSGSWFDLETGQCSSPYQPQDMAAKADYLETLRARPYPHQQQPLPTFEEFELLVPAAFERLETTRQQIGFESETEVVVRVLDGRSAVLSMNGKGWRWCDDDEADQLDRFVRFEVVPQLLFNILRGPKFGHWNNAEIGSHIRFFRQPDKFERGLYYCMNFFHADESALASVGQAA